MKCPRCGREQPESLDCAFCGVVIDKYLERLQRERVRLEPAPKPPRPPRTNPFSKAKVSPTLPTPEKLAVFLFPGDASKKKLYLSLSRILKAGIGVEEALRKIAGTARGRIQTAARRALDSVRAGSPLSVAMSLAPYEFTALERGLLALGERTGRITEVLDRLVLQEEHILENRRKFLSHLAYPFVLLVLSAFLLPIPLLVSGGEAAYGADVASRLAWTLGGALLAWPASRALSFLTWKVVGRFPPSLEMALFPGTLALFFRSLADALESGLGMRDTLQLTRDAWHSRKARNLVDAAVASIESGATLLEALPSLIPGRDHILVLAGEESGTLAETFSDLAKGYSQAADRRRKMLLLAVAGVMGLVLMLVLASQIMSGLEQQLMPSMEDLEGMELIDEQLKGIMKPLKTP